MVSKSFIPTLLGKLPQQGRFPRFFIEETVMMNCVMNVVTDLKLMVLSISASQVIALAMVMH